MKEIEELVAFERIHSADYMEQASHLRGPDANMQCFQDLVEPDDITQGKLGNCWFLASCGAVAERFPGHIKSLFLKHPTMDNSRCVIRLYNPFKQQWEKVVIDDYIPVFKKTYMDIPKHTTLFARPNGHETWVILLEKAMAKFHGGYAFLKGGYARHAMACLTGAEVSGWVQTDRNYWKQYKIDYSPENDHNPHNIPKQRFHLQSAPQRGHKDSKEILKLLLVYLYKGFPMTCGFKEKGSGIITGHSYSLLDIFPKSSRDMQFVKSRQKEFPILRKTQLLKLRNPYAMGEWTGDWRDDDPKWSQMKDLKEYLQVKCRNDGTFWMDFTSWRQQVVKIDICHFEGYHNIPKEV